MTVRLLPRNSFRKFLLMSVISLLISFRSLFFDSHLAGVQRSLDFYGATAADSTIHRIYLAGGCAKVPALARSIQSKTGVAVEEINPFKQLDTTDKQLDPEFLRRVAPMATISVGLALRTSDPT